MPLVTPVTLGLLAPAALLLLLLTAVSCSESNTVGQRLPRVGDEIVVCGQFFHTGTKVVLWTDPGGFDAYRVENHFGDPQKSQWTGPTPDGPQTPNRYGPNRLDPLDPRFAAVRATGWDLPTLRSVVDQFVIHYDGTLRSADTFKTLHDQRGLSVHFMLDIDGTIYQTLDLKERAWHATIANGRSVGIEIANLGAFPAGTKVPGFARYQPSGLHMGLVNSPNDCWLNGQLTETGAFWFLPNPGSKSNPQVHVNGPALGKIHDQNLWQMDFTHEQYRSLAQLTTALTRIFPNLPATYPKDEKGQVLTRQLTSEEFAKFHGILGHYHIQSNKIDPGPAFQWDWLIKQVKAGKIVDPMPFAYD